ncbi:hypothetical protein BU26DRAFT_11692 [Trematosphaeria pertusa]|uniref:Uncharacterized protein n=1 Tax=Trematosphaeria pertusa TaxID=390896 RepID=A0A6A6J371_9PLEO|nr:uncharacterized protein BU26DRAFT_11692 [Trematosphaeria pertusa]KAF2255913.1 hypothetical protein BU26DRAFT_11692 [Trematosphaeria pertusa]
MCACMLARLSNPQETLLTKANRLRNPPSPLLPRRQGAVRSTLIVMKGIEMAGGRGHKRVILLRIPNHLLFSLHSISDGVRIPFLGAGRPSSLTSKECGPIPAVALQVAETVSRTSQGHIGMNCSDYSCFYHGNDGGRRKRRALHSSISLLSSDRLDILRWRGSRKAV